MLKKILTLIFGSKQDRDMKKMKPTVLKINEFEGAVSALTSEQLRAKTDEFRQRLEKGETLDDILPEAFAVVRETSKRTLGMRHFDVQMMGGIALHENKISEMKTGEGKTLVATLSIYLNALPGKGVHLVTVNDYLAKRDALWMGPIYRFLGLSVGIINHEKSYRVEWEDISNFKTMTVACDRREAYRCDITYGTNNEFGFDYLRDNMVFSMDQKVQRGHNYSIVDEVDSILIDEARTPLIISGPAEEAADLYYKVDKIVPRLTEAQINEKKEPIEGTGDYAVDEKDKTAVLTEMGIDKVEKLLGIKDLYSPKNAKIVHHVLQAIKAHKLYDLDVEYVIENGEVVIVDEFTGRKMPGRRWSEGLHQAIEAKERVQIKQEFQTLATVTFQNYFRMYKKLAGMTGTAETEATEFYSIYKLDVAVIPTNVAVVRKDAPDKIYLNENAKFKTIVRDVVERHKKGQPILLGTVSVEKSEKLAKLLTQQRVKFNVLNAKYHEKEAEIIANAGLPYSVTIATNMAGRGTDIKLGQGVVDLGGLHVIGSERHEARRIDNQLRGRSGRQGDPGSTQFYVSLQDDLMRLFGMDNNMALLQRFGFSEEEEIQSRMISNAIEGAQKRVENRNFEIRKNLLEYDNVMNEQRIFVYSIRDRILEINKKRDGQDGRSAAGAGRAREADGQDGRSAAGAVAAEEIGIIDDFIRTVVTDYVNTLEKPTKTEMWDKEAIQKWFRFTFFTDIDIDFASMDYTQAIDRFCEKIKDLVWHKFVGIPDEIRAEGFKYVVLNVLDNRWKEHLRNIDFLQEGIGLRGYAQKNPIVEYKLEAYNLFASFKNSFMTESLSLLCRLEIQTNVEAVPDTQYESTPSRVQTIHNEYGQFDTMGGQGGGAAGAQQGKKPQAGMGGKPQPVRKMEKLGRNDPCWCGSGKKYKNCHMDEDQRKERGASANIIRP